MGCTATRACRAHQYEWRRVGPPVVGADSGQQGHQIMPSFAIAGNRLLLAYYDLQEDRSGVVDTKYIDDQTAHSPARYPIGATRSTSGP